MTYEEYLEKNGEMTYTNRGTSMLPLLKQGRDMFTVRRKGSERCRKYDVVLYRRPPDKYVLHRIVGVGKEGYVLLGDNCLNKEYGITDTDIIGVMTRYVHKGKEHTTGEIGYQVYSRFIVLCYPFRKIKFRIKQIFKNEK